MLRQLFNSTMAAAFPDMAEGEGGGGGVVVVVVGEGGGLLLEGWASGGQAQACLIPAEHTPG